MEEIKSKIESLLFMSARPMLFVKLAEILGINEGELRTACESLMADYSARKGGLCIIINEKSIQMTTSGDNSSLIKDFIKEEITGELSKPSLETLTIIAYKGPISKSDLDMLRGVNCALILRNLLLRGLVEVKEDKGKDESFYSASLDLLKFLGISQTSELPEFERLSNDETIARLLKDKAEQK